MTYCKWACCGKPTRSPPTRRSAGNGPANCDRSYGPPQSGQPAAVTAPLGRPGQLVRLDEEHPRFLGIQLGVVETSAALLPVSVSREDHWEFKFPTTNGPDAWQKNLHDALDKIVSPSIWGIIVSVPGVVDEAAGKVLFSPNLHWTERVDLAALIRQVWQVPVLLVQEIRALAVGHMAMEPEGEDFLLVDFGQGVGGAVVLGGKLYSNPLPLNGELGHTPVPNNPRRCGCGAVGCVETLISRRGLLESLAAQTPSQPTTWPELATRVAQRGVEPWLAVTLDAMAAIIAGAMNVLGVRRVIITGSLNELSPCVMDYLSAGVQRGAMWARFGQVFCQPAPRRRAAGLIGAGIDRLLFPDSEWNRKKHQAARTMGGSPAHFQRQPNSQLSNLQL